MGGSLFVYKEGWSITAIITLNDITYSFSQNNAKPLITNLSLHVNYGEFVSVIGASGSGKSTLFKLIAGLLEPTAGEIQIAGQRNAKRLGKVAYMPQKDLLLPWRTVLDNCLLPSEIMRSDDRNYRRNKQDELANVRDMLLRFGLASYEQAYPDECSGGMRQRVAFVRTLACGQDMLLLDEPFGALDAMTKRAMHRWLLQLWGDLNKTVLFITHDLEEAILLSDRIYLMPNRDTDRVQEIRVDLPRPRHYEMNYEPAFIQLRQELEHRLYAQSSH